MEDQTHMIFVLSPGRCGTGYLAKMMATVPSVDARHEPQPDFASVAKDAQHDLSLARTFWTEKKLPAIRALGPEVYFETSHVFAHGFADALLDLGMPADVVGLSRSPRQTALSLWRRRSIPGRTGRGLNYLLHPANEHNRLPLSHWENLDDYQLCYWHVLEIEARTEELLPRFEERGARTYRTSIGDLVDGPGFNDILDAMELPDPRPEYETRRDWRVNANPAHYNEVWPEGDLNELEAGVWDAVR